MAKVPAKEPSLNDALQGDLFANALTGTPTKDLKDIPSDGDNAKANTKAKAKAKASAKAKSTSSAPAHSQSQDKSQATGNSHNKAQAKIEAKAETKADSNAKAKNKTDVKGEAKAKAKLKAKHQGQSLASGKENSNSNEVLLEPCLELILDAVDGSNADMQVISPSTATASALTKVKANKHAHKANKSQDKDFVLDAKELSNRANMGLLTDTEQTLLSPLFIDVLLEQNILEESKDSLLTPHMSSLLEGQELEGQALESEIKTVSCTEVNSSASASASSSASANTSDSDSTSASSSESAQSQSDASNSDTNHSDTKGKSNESVKPELGLGSLGSLGALGANLPDSGEFELKVQTLQELEALDKASGQDKADTDDNNAKQGSLFLEGYVVGQGGLFDDVNDEVVNNNDDIELVYVPLKEVSLQEKFSDVLAPSENLPELGEDESYSDVDIYAPQEPAFNFFEPSPDSLQASQFPSLGSEISAHTSAGGSASVSTGANAEVKAMDEGEAVMVNHEIESDSTMATKSQDDTKVKATATRKARAGAKASAKAGSKSRVKVDSKDGTGPGAGAVTQEGADAGAEAEAGAGAGANTGAKAKAKAKVVYESYEYPIDPKVYAVCGIDEAGRGPLMGDVVAACVILDHNHMIEGLNDSKKLTEKARDALAPIIKEQAIAYGIGRASPQEIDSLNILNATFLAMRRAFDAMQKSCNLALIDGNKIPKTFSDIPMVMEAVVKGDARVAEISAASILAKTTRDADCYELDKLYPEYGFARHKGYPTKDHLEALAKLPILPCYRKSYGPVKKLLAGSQDEVGNISPNVQKRLETAKDTKQKKLDELLAENTLISLDDFA